MFTPVIIFSSIISCILSEDPTTDSPEKQALRYGFQNIGACKDFEKAWLCVRKCLDLDYDVAVADKHCNCKCYTKPDKAKYKSTNQTNEQKSGPPTTKLPHWAQSTAKDENKLNDENANESGGNNDSDNEQKRAIIENTNTTEADLGNTTNAVNTRVTDNLAPTTSEPAVGSSTSESAASTGASNSPAAGDDADTDNVAMTESTGVSSTTDVSYSIGTVGESNESNSTVLDNSSNSNSTVAEASATITTEKVEER